MGPNSGGYGGGYMQPQNYGGSQQYGMGRGLGVMGNSAASFDQSQNPWAQSNQTAFNSAYGGSPGGVSNQTPTSSGGPQMLPGNGSGTPGPMGPSGPSPTFFGGGSSMQRGYGGPTMGDGSGSAATIGQGSMGGGTMQGQMNRPGGIPPWQPPFFQPPGGPRPWPPQYQPPVPGTIPPQNGPQPYNPPVFGGMGSAPPVNPYNSGGGMGSHQFGGWYGRS